MTGKQIKEYLLKAGITPTTVEHRGQQRVRLDFKFNDTIAFADMDSKRMQIHIKAAKGKKDRIVNLSEGALGLIKEYYQKHHPKVYLFENEISGEPISTRTIQEVFKIAKNKAGLIKKAGIHSLRHSFATHLHEQGIDIKYIKDLLGHNDLRTTERYTHVSRKDISRVKSPFDNLKLK